MILNNTCNIVDYTWLWSSLIGIFGVVLGTFLGWFLNNLSKIGKLDIFITEWREQFTHKSNYGFPASSENYEEAERYKCNLSFDVNNRSGRQKIMRDIRLEYYSNKKMIFSLSTFDSNNCISSTPFLQYGGLGIINIPANTAIQVDLHCLYWEISNIKQCNTVFLKYIDEKNKIRKIFINQRDYKIFKTEYSKFDSK